MLFYFQCNLVVILNRARYYFFGCFFFFSARKTLLSFIFNSQRASMLNLEVVLAVEIYFQGNFVSLKIFCLRLCDFQFLQGLNFLQAARILISRQKSTVFIS